jgi:hypothetical protein
MTQASRIGFAGRDRKIGGAEEVLGHGAPQVPERLDRRVLLTLDERLRIQPREFTEGFEERRR